MVTIHLKSNRFAEIAKQFHNEASQVVRKTTLDVEAGAKQRVPVDTGLLRNSIQSTMEGELTGVVSTNVEYSIYVEYGTTRMSAQPYMTPAAEAMRQPFIQALQNIGRQLK
jgi:phage protein, HK97 gp10 family